MQHSILAIFADKFCHMAEISSGASHSDINETTSKMLDKAEAMYGEHPMTMMSMAHDETNGYSATMAKVTHDMWGRAV